MTKRQIFSYRSAEGDCPVSQFILHLEPKLQQKLKVQLNELRDPACRMRPPHIKAFRLHRYKGLYELRARLRQMVRIIFCVDDSGNVILLHGFIKKEARATDKALEIARRRRGRTVGIQGQYEEITVDAL